MVKVYYLDDEQALCDIFLEFFSDLDTQVKVFTDAKEAIKECELAPPDIIFIDYRLSDTSGDYVASQLAPNIPKVLVTGELIQPEDSLFLKVISKPYKLVELSTCIDEYLN